MKGSIRFLLRALFVFAPLALFAQTKSFPSESPNPVVVPSRKIIVSNDKTTLLMFPAAVQSADRGAAYVLAERVKGTENALKVKAAMPGFAPSSLTVVTADGQVYVFSVSYAADPPSLAMDFRGAGSAGPAVRFRGQSLNAAEMLEAAERVKGTAPFIRGVHRYRYGIDFKLEGVYMFRDVLLLKFRLHNETDIDYQPASFSFFIRDLRRARRTAVRDNELQSLYRHSWGRPEDADGQVTVVALHRFTIADDKKLAVELREEKGDRSVSLDLKERKFSKAKKLYH